MEGSTVLETDRIRLRIFRKDDLDAFAPIEADPEVMRFYTSGPRTREAAAGGIDWFMGLQSSQGCSPWAVERRLDGQLIGYCGFMPQTIDGHPEMEIAYKIARDQWGQGFATEAAKAVRDWGFDHLSASRFISIIHPENVASIRVAEKSGMTLEKEIDYRGLSCRLYSISRS